MDERRQVRPGTM